MMVEVKKLEKDETKAEFQKADIPFSDNCFAIAAKQGDEVLGTLLYETANGKMDIIKILPQDDKLMADSMLRSAMFIAANRGIFDVFWKETVPDELIKQLGFVKNITNKSIDVTNLFSSCKNCKN